MHTHAWKPWHLDFVVLKITLTPETIKIQYRNISPSSITTVSDKYMLVTSAEVLKGLFWGLFNQSLVCYSIESNWQIFLCVGNLKGATEAGRLHVDHKSRPIDDMAWPAALSAICPLAEREEEGDRRRAIETEREMILKSRFGERSYRGILWIHILYIFWWL